MPRRNDAAPMWHFVKMTMALKYLDAMTQRHDVEASPFAFTTKSASRFRVEKILIFVLGVGKRPVPV